MRTVDTAGWLDMNKALTQGGDKSNPIFKGRARRAGQHHPSHSHERGPLQRLRRGANLPASRSLFMGRQAAMIAYGTGPGSRYQWIEERDDYGNLINAASGDLGRQESRWNNKDFGVVALDSYPPPSTGDREHGSFAAVLYGLRQATSPMPFQAGDVMWADFFYSFASVGLLTTDKLELGLLPAGCQIVDAIPMPESLNGNASIGIMSGEAGLNDAARNRWRRTLVGLGRRLDGPLGAAHPDSSWASPTSTAASAGTTSADIVAGAGQQVTLRLFYSCRDPRGGPQGPPILPSPDPARASMLIRCILGVSTASP